ncbi:hypothetical protein CYMTET_56089 [Cymbomonas tetramitiformis]|uniref:Uncharacterized protein n=1 Tax=Cymbomonas tetramitiformis TaxID=36881 RepID=A0AAE0BD41_9CHLO|nr:hypothetical protein CYMTET_56089 [Cymbomonas tetramitiformis]
MNGRPLLSSDRSDDVILSTRLACVVAHAISFANGAAFLAVRDATTRIGGPRRAVIKIAVIVTGAVLYASPLFNFWVFNSGVVGVAAFAMASQRPFLFSTLSPSSHARRYLHEDGRRSAATTYRAREAPYPSKSHTKSFRHGSSAAMPLYVTTTPTSYRPYSKVSANAGSMRRDTYV